MSMFFVPTCMPIANAATTNASQLNTAVFQWLALQRPMRAARLYERVEGDMAFLLLFLSMVRIAAGSDFAGVQWVTRPAPPRGSVGCVRYRSRRRRTGGR